MNRAHHLWQQLAPDAERLLQGVEQWFGAQPLAHTWTAGRRSLAEEQLGRLRLAWAQERVDLEALWTLKELTADLDLAATVACRASLEAVHDHLRHIVEVTYEGLNQDGETLRLRG